MDVRADDIASFVETVMDTIDAKAARSSPARWEMVCRYFAGCAYAAKLQGATPRGGAARISTHLAQTFSDGADPSGDPMAFHDWLETGSKAGFSEIMDWLADDQAFRPAALRAAIEGA